jgi:phage tail-like protein
MRPFTANRDPQHFDPYKNFRFLVQWRGRVVACFSKVSALTSMAEVVKNRDGAHPNASRKPPGRTDYEAITLEQGVTHDLGFDAWARRVSRINNGLDSAGAVRNFRKDITIASLNEAGQVAIAYTALRCWVSDYQALPELNANGNTVAIQSLKLENEGLLHSLDVKEPKEPS